uniref:Uncharacterized protein n=1 Tax=Anopheles merus TaxID=30066 RepID=A0A182V3X5_ANOME
MMLRELVYSGPDNPDKRQIWSGFFSSASLNLIVPRFRLYLGSNFFFTRSSLLLDPATALSPCLSTARWWPVLFFTPAYGLVRPFSPPALWGTVSASAAKVVTGGADWVLSSAVLPAVPCVHGPATANGGAWNIVASYVGPNRCDWPPVVTGSLAGVGCVIDTGRPVTVVEVAVAQFQHFTRSFGRLSLPSEAALERCFWVGALVAFGLVRVGAASRGRCFSAGTAASAVTIFDSDSSGAVARTGSGAFLIDAIGRQSSSAASGKSVCMVASTLSSSRRSKSRMTAFSKCL